MPAGSRHQDRSVSDRGRPLNHKGHLLGERRAGFQPQRRRVRHLDISTRGGRDARGFSVRPRERHAGGKTAQDQRERPADRTSAVIHEGQLLLDAV